MAGLVSVARHGAIRCAVVEEVVGRVGSGATLTVLSTRSEPTAYPAAIGFTSPFRWPTAAAAAATPPCALRSASLRPHHRAALRLSRPIRSCRPASVLSAKVGWVSASMPPGVPGLTVSQSQHIFIPTCAGLSPPLESRNDHTRSPLGAAQQTPAPISPASRNQFRGAGGHVCPSDWQRDVAALQGLPVRDDRMVGVAGSGPGRVCIVLLRQ